MAVARRWFDRVLLKENLALALRIEEILFTSGGDQIMAFLARVRDW
jgi:hypothetical protein